MIQSKLVNEALLVITGLGMLGLVGFANLEMMETQSKLAEVKSDFLALGTALDQHRIDRGEYPKHLPEQIDLDGYGNLRQGDMLTLPLNLTTPVAYLNEYPTDPFKRGALVMTGPSEALPYESGEIRDIGYIWLEMEQADPYNFSENFGFFSSRESWEGAFNLWGGYRLSSIGPAQKYPFTDGFRVSYASIDSFYDPTNGLMSLGMVTLTQFEGSRSRDRWVILGEPIPTETFF